MRLSNPGHGLLWLGLVFLTRTAGLLVSITMPGTKPRVAKQGWSGMGCTYRLSLRSKAIFGEDIGDGFPKLPTWSPAAPGEAEFWVRFFFHGGKLTRDGVLRRLLLREADLTVLHGRKILDLLSQEGVDLSKFTPHAYSNEGWVELTDVTEFDLTGEGPNRVDIKLMPPPVPTSLVGPQDDGYFLMGCMGMKTEANLGTLWRSSYQLGAAGVFSAGTFLIGSRFTPTCTDVLDVHHKIPLVEYADWNHFVGAAPYSARWVAVEMGGEPLETFRHPKRAVYILGSEDNGLPQSVVAACHDHVALPAVRYASYNAAVAGSIVMYDRVAKLALANLKEEASAKANSKTGPPHQ